MTLIMITMMVEPRAAQSEDIMAFHLEQNTKMVKYQVKNQKIYKLGMRSNKGHMIRKYVRSATTFCSAGRLP